MGLQIGNRYEPDPAKWPSTKANTAQNVWFEWEYVKRGVESKPHRAEICVTNSLHHGHRISGNPLGQSAPSHLRFSLDFMSSVAEKKMTGTTYHGISFESETAEFSMTLPNGGTDIQDEPVSWLLPSGRVIWKSLRQLRDAHEDELATVDSTDAYIFCARDLG